MNLKKYIFAYILGCLAAFSIGKIVAMSGAQTTIDAWILTLTIVGQDVGDRMMMLGKVLLREQSSEALVGMTYLVGHSILEEILKFIAFYIVFLVCKPSSIRQIILAGIAVGVGFATFESFGFYSSTAMHMLLGFILRAIGHGLFTGVITLLFGMGYFAQMRWIDGGARGDVLGWFVRYEEKVLQLVWTLFGLIAAAVMHAGVDVFAVFGGQRIAILFMMFGWVVFIPFLLKRESEKPYGTIIREVDLLRTIVEAEKDLKHLETSGQAHILPTLPTEKKIMKILKQFAKS
jgi:RsiW-degrading membrane proteinase PrsW (M82 family)